MGAKSTKKSTKKTDRKVRGTPNLSITPDQASSIRGGAKLGDIKGESLDIKHTD